MRPNRRWFRAAQLATLIVLAALLTSGPVTGALTPGGVDVSRAGDGADQVVDGASRHPTPPVVDGGSGSAAPAATERTAGASTAPPCLPGKDPKRQLRGVWIASVFNLNWPSRAGLTASQQQAELRSLLDQAVAVRLNAIFLQIRPAGDTFWPSNHEPWSQYLTGTQGGDPGYDPLAFAVTEAHARNLELHGWFNPYRVSTQGDVTKLAAGHPARLNPSWVERYDNKLYYNPGVPAARKHTVNVIMDAVSRYDLDGVHFDDYFYPYPVSGQNFNDATEYAAHGAGRTLADWRRSNVDTLVREVASRVRQTKPWVRFGISPFGIWRNVATDPLGSATSGLQSYDAIYADTRRWVRQGWIDYIAPQLYWRLGFDAAAYDVLVPWWSRVVAGTDVQLYIGQAAYRITTWGDAGEMPRHLLFNRDHRVAGDIYYSVNELLANPLGFTDRLRADIYRNPALVPTSPRLPGPAPAAPTGLSAVRTAGGIELSWSAPSGAAPAYYAVHRTAGVGCGAERSRYLLAVRRAGSGAGRYNDPAPPSAGPVTYLVTAVSRLHHQSAPAIVTLRD